ncbi:hypothetical protein Pmar_PMAR012425 [Perkinsus marinus ATCC 50983]|uniref:Uncharacterized protein n=1 Tax=Perkinsus marinus (strain ATCC 50983 / TXsc) TaxID=423536 RepID=C5K7B0_PERM5|nr:hypothetical protein Pmar_PMAR012425 [Perkinsus marinus ATCC 50983]EER19445.1 hypothetical protein Pmar_PMAR012425 [Perkinsus marinus ATCC 50983]|eukprot:XP_002787649.1 hypothetical protein Pmar_PMAR012425 [Perkinsus marinus ATCC 50983]
MSGRGLLAVLRLSAGIVLELDRRIESISNGPPGIVSEIDRRTLLVERDAQVAAAATAEEHMLAAALVCRELQVRVAVSGVVCAVSIDLH